MTGRYYIPAAQAQELSAILADAESIAPSLVADVRRLIFAIEMPDEMVDEIESQLNQNASRTGSSILFTPDVAVELIRSVRRIGRELNPHFLSRLVEGVGDGWLITPEDTDGAKRFNVSIPPLSFDFALTREDVIERSDPDRLIAENILMRRGEAVFKMLDLDPSIPAISGKGRVAVTEHGPDYWNEVGLREWSEYRQEKDDGEEILADLSVRFRAYVLDISEQVGYKIGLNRIHGFTHGEIAVPLLAGKNIMVVEAKVFCIDDCPVGVDTVASGTTYRLGGEGRVDPDDAERLRERLFDRLHGKGRVNEARSRTDRVANADLLLRCKDFSAEDYPLFFADLVRREIFSENTSRCKARLPL